MRRLVMRRKQRLNPPQMRIERPRFVIEALAVNSPSGVAAEGGADVGVGESSRHRPIHLHPPKRIRQSPQLRRTMQSSRTMIPRKKKAFTPKQLKRLMQN